MGTATRTSPAPGYKRPRIVSSDIGVSPANDARRNARDPSPAKVPNIKPAVARPGAKGGRAARGAARPGQVAANAQAASWAMTPGDVAAVTRIVAEAA